MAQRGSNALIAVAGASAPVTNGTIAGILDEAGQGNHLEDILGAPFGVSGLLDNRVNDLGAQKRRVIEGLRRTPGSVLSGRARDLTPEDGTTIVNVLREREVGTLFLLGSLPAVAALRVITDAAARESFPLIAMGVPLSSENDVSAGDHTPGYGSAARTAALGLRDAGRAAQGGDEPVLVIEVLGAECGWLAAATALARDEGNSAPHAVLVPEKPVVRDDLVEELRRAYQKHGYVVVVTTEGARDTEDNSLDGPSLATFLDERLQLPTRFDKPGSLLRANGANFARADADDAYNLGGLAVRLSEEDDTSNYLVLVNRDPAGGDRDKGYKVIESSARLEQVSDLPRQLPDEYLSESGTQPSEAFLEWAKPLIGGALPEYVALG